MISNKTSSKIQVAFQRVTEDPKGLPHAASIALDKHGNVIHSVASGTFEPLSPDKPERQPFTHDTVCWLASCTKLMTTIAALQLVEGGLLSLDGDMTSVLPELKDIQILVDMKETGPVFRPRVNDITLRNLLTHSSGLVYESMDPKMAAWGAWARRNSPQKAKDLDSTNAAKAFLAPLLFEPGEGWAYSTGLDWTGVAIARVSGLPLTKYLEKHIWKPLGMNSTTFNLSERPDLLSRAANMAFRTDDESLTTGKTALKALGVENGAYYVEESGGGGCFSTANDYIKLLRSIHSDDGVLLTSAIVKEMFRPQLANPAHLKRYHLGPGSNPLMGNVPSEAGIDFGLGGLLIMDDLKTVGRHSGSIQWGGMPNLFWWISPVDGVCGCIFQQLLPPGDKLAIKMYQELENDIYSS